METKTKDTVIEGKKYRLFLGEMLGKPYYRVLSVRVQEDGSEVVAFLSNRQWKAESRAKARFAKEIKEHMGIA